MINAIKIALTGLGAASQRISASASNIANVTTTGSLEDGKQAPYEALTTQQKAVTDESGNGQGVLAEVVPKTTPFVPAFDPDSPFADEEGVIGVPNVSLAEEAVNLKLAEITFKANVSVIKAAEELSDELLNTFDEEV